MAMELGTVLHGASVLSKSLDGALEAFSFGDTGYIHPVPFREDIRFDFRAKAVLIGVLKLKFPDISLRACSGFFEVSLLGFVCAMSVDDFLFAARVLVDDSVLLIHEADLYCAVAVVLRSLYLSHHTGACLKHCHRNQSSVFVEDLGHSDFSCQNCFLHFSSLSAFRLST